MSYTDIILIIFQFFIFYYFIVVNLSYSVFIFVALRYIYDYMFIREDAFEEKILVAKNHKPVSVIVPAYNEEKIIVKTVHSLLSLHYPEYEIIVVNDGSDDKTLDKLKEAFSLAETSEPQRLKLSHKEIRNVYLSLDFPNLIVVNKENGGKFDALNAGINISNYPLICCMDADSLLEHDALTKCTVNFIEDRNVVAVGSVIRVLNGCEVKKGVVTKIKSPVKAIEGFQAVEYIRGFLAGRTAWNLLGKSLMIVSGAFGIFRKDIVMNINGFRDTVGEDMDLIVRIHRYCREKKEKYKILFVPVPVCFTQVPSNASSIWRQRGRWQRGLVETLWYNRKMFFNPKYGVIGMFSFPYLVIFESLGPMIELSGYILTLYFLVTGKLSLIFALLFFIVAVLWSILINISCILLDNLLYRRYDGPRSISSLIFYGFLEMFGFRQLLLLDRVMATFMFRSKQWQKFERTKI